MSKEDNCSNIFVFEGIDNVGKTIIIKHLKEYIENNTGYKCITFSFPGSKKRTLGHMVYDIHHNSRKYFDENISEISLQLLHVASHIDLMEKEIIPACNKNYIILLDRFWWSTYSYGLANKLTEKVIQNIISIEKLYWSNIGVKKIFIIERRNRDHDYTNDKEKLIIDNYHKLATECSNSMIVKNDGLLQETVCCILHAILEEI